MNRIKWVFIIVLGVGLLFSICQAEEKLKLSDEKDKVSYGLGYQFGENLKRQKVDVNLEIYASGVRDALAGKDPLMSPEEIRTIVAELQKRIIVARQKEMEEKAEKNLAVSGAFLEENKKKKGVIALSSGLQYKVLKEGAGKIPKMTDTVTVHYRGTLIDGTEFDSSFKKEKPASFKVNSVMRGWAEALQLMKEGSKWQLFIPPNLAYGERGGSMIPPNSVLIFEVELISIAPAQ